MDVIREYFSEDQLALLMGMKIEDVAPGHAVVSMPVLKMHTNGLGAVHGGAVFSLADFCFAVASNSHGRVAVAVNVNVSFFRAVTQGVLTATAHETHLGQRIAGYTVNVTDESGACVANMQGVVYRKKETLEDILAQRTGDMGTTTDT